jgi:hypothetical protein
MAGGHRPSKQRPTCDKSATISARRLMASWRTGVLRHAHRSACSAAIPAIPAGSRGDAAAGPGERRRRQRAPGRVDQHRLAIATGEHQTPPALQRQAGCGLGRGERRRMGGIPGEQSGAVAGPQGQQLLRIYRYRPSLFQLLIAAARQDMLGKLRKRSRA